MQDVDVEDAVHRISPVESRNLEDVTGIAAGAGTVVVLETIAALTALPDGGRRNASAGNALTLARATTEAVDAISIYNYTAMDEITYNFSQITIFPNFHECNSTSKN